VFTPRGKADQQRHNKLLDPTATAPFVPHSLPAAAEFGRSAGARCSAVGVTITKMSYIVLDVPSPIAEHVLSIRQHYSSWRVALPTEITVIGSSGVGVMRYDENESSDVFKIIDDLAKQFKPIVTQFTSVARFPNTGWFYYAQQNPEPFTQLQNAIVETGLKFEPSPFPFTPHCTIADFESPSEELAQEILSLPVPERDIVLDTLSIYVLDDRIMSGNTAGCRLLHRTKLSKTA
jgi:2'-5' RNA ligase